jgi:EAL domain-containing protein (putative c-di-GMP-specific phosphodiesterase class I)/DNA-binding response OmpR family regulator
LSEHTTTHDDRAVVLVVEDEQPVREVFVEALARGGYRGIGAATGREALQVLADRQVDVVLLDRSMPDMSGDALLRRLRSDPRTERLSVVMVTGDATVESKVHGLGAGANDYLVKPVAIRELLARVAAQLEERSRWQDHFRAKLARRSRLSARLAAVPPGRTWSALESELRSVLSEEFEFEQLHLRPRAEEVEPLTKVGRSAAWDEFERDGQRLHTRIPLAVPGGLAAILEVVTVEGRDEVVPTLLDLAPQLASLVADARQGDDALSDTRRWIRGVMAGGRMTGVYQPIVSLASRVVVGAEGLTRFDDGTAPDLAFGSARRAGLSGRLESLALQRLVSGAGGLPSEHWLSVNLSAATLLSEDVDEVLACADRPIVLEITEHEHVADYAALRARSAALVNVRFAVDDAGAGYASLRHIFELKPHLVKLDRSWVAGIDTDPARQALVRGMVGFTDAIDAIVVGEGIESEPEAATLAALGVQLGQGYLFGHPAAA